MEGNFHFLQGMVPEFEMVEITPMQEEAQQGGGEEEGGDVEEDLEDDFDDDDEFNDVEEITDETSGTLVLKFLSTNILKNIKIYNLTIK